MVVISGIIEFRNVSYSKNNNMILENISFSLKKNKYNVIIGKNGKMLKDIGMEARQEIEDLLGEKIYLGLWVKVKDDWRKKKPFLKEMGYVEEK